MSFEIDLTFTHDQFIDRCVENLSRAKTTVISDIFDAIFDCINSDYFSPMDVLSIKKKYSCDLHDPHLSIPDYIESGGMTLWYPRIEVCVKQSQDFHVDDIKLPSFIKLKPIEYAFGKKSYTKIKKTILKTKTKFDITFNIVQISSALLKTIQKEAGDINVRLLPSNIGTYGWQQTFYNKLNGDVFLCSCFESAITKSPEHFVRHPHSTKAIKLKSYKDEICHVCQGFVPDPNYCHSMYGSVFKTRYGGYIEKTAIEYGVDTREAENIVRASVGVAKIGERWINETLLFNIVKSIFPDLEVRREASPEWLGRQRLDVYIPNKKLAIEYHGKQHFEAVKLFGGDEALSQNRQRDAMKLQKCTQNGVRVIYFNYKEDLSESLVRKKLDNYIN